MLTKKKQQHRPTKLTNRYSQRLALTTPSRISDIAIQKCPRRKPLYFFVPFLNLLQPLPKTHKNHIQQKPF